MPESGNISLQSSALSDVKLPHGEHTISSKNMKMSEPMIYAPQPPSRSSSMTSIIIPGSQSEEPLGTIDYDGCDDAPLDERTASIWSGRRYRLLLTHDYHASRMFI